MSVFLFAPVTAKTDNSLMKHILLITFLSFFVLSACQQTSTPEQVAEQYWQALKNGDNATAKKLVSKNSQKDLDNYLSLPDENIPALNGIKLGATKTSINTTINDQINFETILVLEQGKWKIDASRSQPLASQQPDQPSDFDQLSGELQENMGQALEEGTDMLNKFMEEGSKEMSESLLKGMNKMNEALREATEKMKQRREQQDTPQQPPAKDNGEGLI